jgi:hypothetical protein
MGDCDGACGRRQRRRGGSIEGRDETKLNMGLRPMLLAFRFAPANCPGLRARDENEKTRRVEGGSTRMGWDYKKMFQTTAGL